MLNALPTKRPTLLTVLPTKRPDYWDSEQRELRHKNTTLKTKIEESHEAITKMREKIKALEKRQQGGGKGEISTSQESKHSKTEKRKAESQPVKKVPPEKIACDKAVRAARFAKCANPSPAKPKRNFAWSSGKIQSNKEEAIGKYMEKTKKKKLCSERR